MKNYRSTTLLLATIPVAVIVIFGLMLAGRVGDVVAFSASGSLLPQWFYQVERGMAVALVIAGQTVLASVFAISMTVVAIVVQLSATRYTARVVDLFLADPFNILIFFVYVVPLLYGFWLARTFTEGVEFHFQFSLALYMGMVTLSTTIVIPYFRYLFFFLQPGHIIETIVSSIEKSLAEAVEHPKRLEKPRQNISNSIRQLSDIALASIGRSDILLALQCIGSIRQAAVHYLEHKHRLPDAWFRVDRNHLVGISEDMWRELVARRTWLEMEVFKQFEIAFTSSLRRVRDINSYVARGLRDIGEAAVRHSQDDALDLIIKAFNTFINYALGERDIRSCVNVLYQYRLLGEAVLHRPEMIQRIAAYFLYYGHNSQRRGIYLVLDAVAYDLRALTERACSEHPESTEVLLEQMLQLAKAPGLSEEQRFLQTVRKSQALLGAFFLHRNRPELAERIMEDMRGEPEALLEAVQNELSRDQSREFLEIEDRGVSFYYVEPERREALEAFFRQVRKKGG